MPVTFSVAHIWQSIWLMSPLLALIVAGLAVLVVDVSRPTLHRWTLPAIGIIGMLVSFILVHAVGCIGANGEMLAFMGTMRTSYTVYLAQNVILGCGIFLLLLSPQYLTGRRIARGEYYSLFTFAIMAMMALAASGELLTLFLNLEMLSITLYVLVGIEHRNSRASEAAFKYFLLGSVAAAFLLLGIAFVFGATGDTTFAGIAAAVRDAQFSQPLYLILGLCLMIVGFGFKLTLAPFHMYAPDVYEGAPSPVAAAIATGSKVAGFTVMFSLISAVIGEADPATNSVGTAAAARMHGIWIALYAVAVASFVVGNVGAVVQPNIKRMLAYSSIANSGYMLVPIIAMLGEPRLVGDAGSALAYYLLAYALMTLLAFGVAMTLGARGEGKIGSYAGLYSRSPYLAVLMMIAMISLIGIPPTLGFFGKWQMFLLIVRSGSPGLAIIAFLASVASAFYYLRVTVAMFMQEAPEPESLSGGAAHAAAAQPPSAALLKGPGAPGRVSCVALGISAAALFIFAVFPWLYLFAK